MSKYSILFVALFLLAGCAEKESVWKPAENALFRKMTPEETGISFVNTLTLQEGFDVFRYRNFYNGGGVGIGDINNDGLADVFLTSNMGDNKLFLNKGGWKFEDITEKAGVKGTKVWSTGVSMADINHDGFLDIYVCNSGDINGDNRENELFINNGDLTFKEQARDYGLADYGFSTHAAFFDYDKDGDLDCFVLNNSFRPIGTLGYRNLRNERDELGGDKLFRNDHGVYHDVSARAGIFGSVIGFGLGITIGDVNQDNWPDLYISNDFYERDYLYINQKDGTFSEELEKYMGHISMFSMGADLADMNNDGYPEIFSTDMLPADEYRLKTVSDFEKFDVYQLRLRNGYYHQFMRNMLQMNRGDSSYVEVGYMSGVAATDWSWGALMADFDNDQYREIYVANGIYKDVTDQDFVEFLGSSEQIHAAIDGKKIDFKQFVDKMSSRKLSNFMFRRTGDWQYENVANAWGVDEPSFSNGAAYGDLDNDGDLDLIVNNVNQDLFVFQNRSREINKHHYLSFEFKGSGLNRFGLGSTVRVYTGGQTLTYDHMPIRGFQSSMDYRMLVGMGDQSKADSITVTWPNSYVQTLRNVEVDRVITLNFEDAAPPAAIRKAKQLPMFTEASMGTIWHQENEFNDFDRDRLLYHMLSTTGPAFAVADLNGDGFDDFFMGGGVGKEGHVYLQAGSGYQPLKTPSIALDSLSEDVDAEFFDADGDRDLDLYVVSGGSEYASLNVLNNGRLYINVGTTASPRFERKKDAIPPIYLSGSCVRPADVDGDGDLDLFLGTRQFPGYYGTPADQTLLLNDGKGNFKDVTAAQAPEFKHLGMVTDAQWFDHDKDGDLDLMMVGDWMPITIFHNNKGQLTLLKEVKGLEQSNGWWNRLEALDVDGDGDMDFVAGNLGTNSKFQPSRENPVTLLLNDFDQNGSVDPVFAHMRNGKLSPTALRQDLIRQMSSLKKKVLYYKDYANKSLDELFDPKLIEQATKLQFYEPHSATLVNNGDGSFTFKPLPVSAQTAPVFAIASLDADGNSSPDLMVGGNLYAVRPEEGRYDALLGELLTGAGDGTWTAQRPSGTGLQVRGETRHIARLRTRQGTVYAWVRNNTRIKFYKR